MNREQFYKPFERGFERDIHKRWNTGRGCGQRRQADDRDSGGESS